MNLVSHSTITSHKQLPFYLVLLTTLLTTVLDKLVFQLYQVLLNAISLRMDLTKISIIWLAAITQTYSVL
jgi:hypothetical protein